MAFTQIHISGLPTDCEDAEVESALRRLCAFARHGANAERSGNGSADEIPEVQKHNQHPAEENERNPCNDRVEEVPDEHHAGNGCAEIEERTGDLDQHQSEVECEAACREQAEAEILGDPEDEEEYLDGFCGCVVVRDKHTYQCKGYCFLTVVASEEADHIIRILNDGSEICGAKVTAQVAKPKDRGGKPEKEVELPDLRVRRKRYAATGCKKAQMGHMSCSDKSKTMTKTTGRVDNVAGTRGGKTLVLDEGKYSSRSGFQTAF